MRKSGEDGNAPSSAERQRPFHLQRCARDRRRQVREFFLQRFQQLPAFRRGFHGGDDADFVRRSVDGMAVASFQPQRESAARTGVKAPFQRQQRLQRTEMLGEQQGEFPVTPQQGTPLQARAAGPFFPVE